jgi:hypothetical protein
MGSGNVPAAHTNGTHQYREWAAAAEEDKTGRTVRILTTVMDRRLETKNKNPATRCVGGVFCFMIGCGGAQQTLACIRFVA